MKDGWSVKKLGEVCSFIRGLTYTKSDEIEFSHNCVLRSNNIDLDTKTLIFDDLKYVRDDLKIGTDKFVVPNSILICMSNGSKQHIGKVAFIDKDYGYAFGGFMGLIIPINVNSKYVYYSCLSSSYKSFLENIGNGANITNLKFVDLGQFQIPIPPLPEQFRIVEELDQLSNIIEKKRQQLSELDNLAQSIFYDMFGDPVTNEKGWEVKKLGDIAYIGLGFTHTPEYVDEGIPFLSVKDITKGEICWDKIKFVSKKEYESAPRGAKPNKGDILFCRVGTMGKPVIIKTDKPFCTFVSLGYLHLLNNEIVNVYVKYWMLSYAFDIQVEANVKGLAIKNLNTGWLKTFNIQIPPLDLQQLFAQKIEAIEKEKELIKQSIKETEELFNSRMDYYF